MAPLAVLPSNTSKQPAPVDVVIVNDPSLFATSFHCCVALPEHGF
jgi:hypothetical protein